MTSFHLSGFFDHHVVFDRFGEALHHFQTDFGVTHFTAAEANRHFHLVAAFHEADGVTNLGLKIGDVGVESEANLFDFHHALIFAGFFFALGLFEAIFTVIHDAADGRLRVRSDLDKVEVALVGELLRVARGHDAELFAVVTDHTNFGIADLFIDLRFFRSDVNTPPKNDGYNKKRGLHQPA